MPDNPIKSNEKKNFLDRFSYQILQFCTDSDIIRKGDRILISISGGLDSVSLFRLLHSFRLKIKLDLHLVHFHHGLRIESDEEEEFIRSLAKEFNTPVTVVRADGLKNQKGLQEKARKWRFEKLNQLAKQLEFNKIALGHHLGDLVETQLWKLTRGTSLFGLNPIQSVNPPYIRPLLQTSKEELRFYLKSIGQEWREDLSNQHNDYTRNLIRNKIVPLLEECAGGRLSHKMFAISQESACLNDYFDELFPVDSYQTDSLSYDLILNHNKLLSCELIHRYLLYHQQTEINRENLERIYGLVKQRKGNWQIVLKNSVKVKGVHKKIQIEKDILV